jgi:hypothetical protein
MLKFLLLEIENRLNFLGASDRIDDVDQTFQLGGKSVTLYIDFNENKLRIDGAEKQIVSKNVQNWHSSGRFGSVRISDALIPKCIAADGIVNESNLESVKATIRGADTVYVCETAQDKMISEALQMPVLMECSFSFVFLYVYGIRGPVREEGNYGVNIFRVEFMFE